MRRKVKITFEIDCKYPYIEKETEKLSKEFDQWFKIWSSPNNSGRDIIPVLYDKSDEHQPNGTVRVKVERDGEEILNTWWDELSDDF